MAKSVRSTSIKNKYVERKWWLVFWWGPNFFFTAREKFLGGEPDKVISRLALLRAIGGIGTLVFITFRYPGYIAGAQQLIPTAGRLWPGVGTGLRFADFWVTSIVFSIILLAMWAVLFALLMVSVTRPRAIPGLLLHLCWPALAIVLFLVQFFLIVKLVTWAAPRLSSLNWVEDWGAVVAFVVVYIWFFKAAFLVATGVFRADDAHPLMAPFVATGVSWTLACKALSSGGPSGVPHGIWLLSALGPVSVTGLSAYACWRMQKDHGQLLFLDGPPAGSDYRPAPVRSAYGPSRREFARMAAWPAVVIVIAACLVPVTLALASTWSYQAMTFMGGPP